MEFGQDKTIRPLLSITIPTFNRARILNDSLAKLLPQIERHGSKIELIISDNASEDNTQEIINYWLGKYPELNIKTYLQSYNTGYYGNFKKCAELATGSYMWLLSDNEHLNKEFIPYLIAKISSSQFNVGAYFLNNVNAKRVVKNKYISQIFAFDEIVKKGIAYKMTLISSIVFLNLNAQNMITAKQYEGNSFLGFMFLINSLKIFNQVQIIKGSVFTSVPATVSFDIFKSWSKDITECVNYMKKEGVANDKTINIFTTSHLKNIMLRHILLYKANGNLYEKDYGDIQTIRLNLKKYYSENKYFSSFVDPWFDRSRFLAKIMLINLKIKFKSMKLKNSVGL